MLCVQVMIFDYDVHHGNGTHDIFYGDPDILFISTHQQGSYPGTGKLTEVGTGAGEHTTINLPLPGMMSRAPPVHILQSVFWVLTQAASPHPAMAVLGTRDESDCSQHVCMCTHVCQGSVYMCGCM